ncbi:helix-turn-helix transcriptional regulator [Jiulongibacter sp. NS-SX5]|uniref:helix-turn-helix transcriptional regulator n=1 Tax=Jiulongibacter sp. NS-SX5 TaxID=3463854 RepID=UPI004057D7FE
MPRLDRLTSILIQLQSKRIVKAQEIADRFEISLRTVYRDIRTLEQAGVPIISEAGIGYSIMKEYRLPPVHFTEEEALSFVTAEKFIENLTDTSTMQAFQSALYKIKAVLASQQKEMVDGISESIAVLKNRFVPETSNDTLQISHILKAIAEKKVISMQYNSQKAESTNREVEPIGTYNSGNKWYMIAYCRLRKDYRNFRIDRIDDFSISKERFTEQHPGLQSFLSQTQSEKEVTEVIIRLDPDIVNRLGDQHFYMGFVNQTEHEEYLEMTFLSPSLHGFSHWFLMFGAYAEIVKPEALKELVQQRVSDIQERLNFN